MSSQAFLASRAIKQKQGVSFHFTYPSKTGLSLHSVEIDHGGIPKLVFNAANCRELPTLTEEDVATVARVVSEGKRPEFFYRGFLNPSHPFFNNGRLYKLYSPQYLRGTSIGNLLSEADWSMKCLHVGTRSNDLKTEFSSWKKTSQLDNLATHMDFPYDETKRGCVLMSCDHVVMEESENEILFTEEPKMRITDQSKPMYSEYITEYYDRVAYYDEPLFLKMQELMKLIVAMEWMKEKGVVFSEKWLKFHTEKFLPQAKAITTKLDEKIVQKLLHSASLAPSLEAHADGPYGPVSMKFEMTKKTSSGVEHTITQYCPALSLENIIMMRSTYDDYDFLFEGMNCQMPFDIDDDGKIFTPDVRSWNELFAETVPVPHTVQELKDNQGTTFSIGGITTRETKAKAKPVKRVTRVANSETTEVIATKKIQPQQELRECKRNSYQTPPTNVKAGTLEEHLNKTNISDTHHGYHSAEAVTSHSSAKNTSTNFRTVKISVTEARKIDDRQVGPSVHSGMGFLGQKKGSPQKNHSNEKALKAPKSMNRNPMTISSSKVNNEVPLNQPVQLNQPQVQRVPVHTADPCPQVADDDSGLGSSRSSSSCTLTSDDMDETLSIDDNQMKQAIFDDGVKVTPEDLKETNDSTVNDTGVMPNTKGPLPLAYKSLLPTDNEVSQPAAIQSPQLNQPASTEDKLPVADDDSGLGSSRSSSVCTLTSDDSADEILSVDDNQMEQAIFEGGVDITPEDLKDTNGDDTENEDI